MALSDLLMAARDDRLNGRAADAGFLYREVLAVYPANVDALYGLATVEHSRGAHLEAEHLLHRARFHAPGDARVEVALAEVRRGLGRREHGDRSIPRKLAGRGRPWLSALAQRPRVWKYRALSSCERVSGTPIVYQPVLFAGYGEVILGEGVQFGWRASPHFYTGYCYVEAALPNARVEIGDHVEINNGAMLKSEGPGIRIGRDGLFGAYVEIYDSDFHELDPRMRQGGHPKMAPVDIGENVFVGMGVRILKGVTVGANSVIGAGAVVTTSIPAGVVAAGNPARIVREL
jgi:acetyltransferase-like isoleucine patch superfamily enzyme